MIVGHGDIASILPDHPARIYFVSGVSNSQETRDTEYQREIALLFDQDTLKHLVYFSTLSVFYADTRYTRHKRFMEEMVKSMWHDRYTIIRVGNISWGTNPHTLINFIRNKIRNREHFEIQDVYRYVVEKDEFLYWIDHIPDFPCEMAIMGRRMKVIDIVKQYCYPWNRNDSSFARIFLEAGCSST